MQIIKYYFPLAIFLIITVSSCSFNEIDSSKAKACSDGYLDALKSGNKEDALKFYSSEFDNSESPEKKMEKLQRLEEVLGPVTSYELLDSLRVSEGDFPAMSFTYKVMHPKVNTIEKFIIIKDAGDYKITAHQVESEN